MIESDEQAAKDYAEREYCASPDDRYWQIETGKAVLAGHFKAGIVHERAQTKTLIEQVNIEARQWCADLFPCQKLEGGSCDKYGICSDCSDASLVLAGISRVINKLQKES